MSNMIFRAIIFGRFFTIERNRNYLNWQVLLLFLISCQSIYLFWDCFFKTWHELNTWIAPNKSGIINLCFMALFRTIHTKTLSQFIFRVLFKISNLLHMAENIKIRRVNILGSYNCLKYQIIPQMDFWRSSDVEKSAKQMQFLFLWHITKNAKNKMLSKLPLPSEILISGKVNFCLIQTTNIAGNTEILKAHYSPQK